MSFKGKIEVSKNLQKALEDIRNMTMKGLIEVNILIRNDMENTQPLIPVDTGHLRASWFGVTGSRDALVQRQGEAVPEVLAAISSMKDPATAFGFTAEYAFRVHEDMQSTFKRPGAGPKFLEAALRRNEHEIMRTLKDNIRL